MLRCPDAVPTADHAEGFLLLRFLFGGELGRLLRNLSGYLRDEARTRSELESRQAWSINGARLPFSDAVRVGDLLFLAGAIGISADGKIPAGIDAQARQAMDNIAAVLAKSGVGWGDVVKCTVMLDEIGDWPAFNKVYVTYFPTAEFPARSAFGAGDLAANIGLRGATTR